jgi:hypothetical protein
MVQAFSSPLRFRSGSQRVPSTEASASASAADASPIATRPRGLMNSEARTRPPALGGVLGAEREALLPGGVQPNQAAH